MMITALYAGIIVVDMRKDGPMTFVLILLLSIFGPISTDMYLSGLPDMLVAFDTNETVMTATLYCFMLSLAISVLFIGPLSDKYGRRRILIPSMIVYIVSNILCGLCSDIVLFIILRIIEAIGAGGALAISVALVKDCFEGERMGKILSAVSVLGMIGPIASPVVGTAILSISDWRATFWFPAAVAAFCLAESLFLEETLRDDLRYKGSIYGAVANVGRLLGRGSFTKFAILSNCVAAAFLGYIAVSSYIYQEGFGTSSAEYTAFLAVTLIISIAGMFLIGKVNARIGNSRMIPVYAVIWLVACVLLSTIGYMGKYQFMLGMVVLASITMSMRPYGFGILLTQFDGENGAVSSILNFLVFGFGVVGMIVASLPWGNFVTGVAVCSIMGLAIFCVMWLLLHFDRDRLKGLEEI